MVCGVESLGNVALNQDVRNQRQALEGKCRYSQVARVNLDEGCRRTGYARRGDPRRRGNPKDNDFARWVNGHSGARMPRLRATQCDGIMAQEDEPFGPKDARLLRLMRASFVASHGVYGAPRVFLDLREAGETCSKHRVARLMRVNKIRAVGGYRTRHPSASKPAELVPNVLLRNFDVTSPKNAWVTDITYVRTWQG